LGGGGFRGGRLPVRGGTAAGLGFKPADRGKGGLCCAKVLYSLKR